MICSDPMRSGPVPGLPIDQGLADAWDAAPDWAASTWKSVLG